MKKVWCIRPGAVRHLCPGRFESRPERANSRHVSRNRGRVVKIHEVNADFIRSIPALGFKDLTTEPLMKMSIHGVTPEFVRERATGFENLTPEHLVKMKIHGVDSGYVRLTRRH